MDKKKEEAAPGTGGNPLYQGSSRPAPGGDSPDDSVNETDDAVSMQSRPDDDEQPPEDRG